MRPLVKSLAALAALASISGCADARLEDAIRQYIDQRVAEIDAGCECFELLINPENFDTMRFESQDECLSVFTPVGESEAIDCISQVLSSGKRSKSKSIDIMNCYTEQVAAQTECYLENADQCSPTMCASDISAQDRCQEDLTNEEVEDLYYCVVN